MPKFALQFIAGKYEGGNFVLADDKDLTIGRSTEVEVVLIEDMVSRRHATLSSHSGRLILRDLGSTNGTFVNGERVEACELEFQDRVLVGTSMMRIVSADRVAAQTAEFNVKATLVGALPQDPSNAAQAAAPLGQGTLTEVQLRDVVRRCDADRRTGNLLLTVGDERIVLTFDTGKLTHASMASDDKVTALNALRHALSWSEGQFVFTDGPPTAATASFAQDTQATLQLALSQNEQTRRRYQEKWQDAPHISLVQPPKTPLRTLTPAELDALELALSWHSIEAVLEHAHHDDFVLLGCLEDLVARGVLQNGQNGP